MIIDSSKVPEMTEVKVTDKGVVFGASVTLSTMEEFLQETIEHLPGRFTLVLWTAQTRLVTMSVCVFMKMDTESEFRRIVQT